MAYTKTLWTDRQVTTPMTFTVSAPIVAGTPFLLTPSEGTVTTGGTPLSAGNLNNIENGLVDHEARVTAMESGKLSLIGGTMTGKMYLEGSATSVGASMEMKSSSTQSNTIHWFNTTTGTRIGYLGKSTTVNDNLIFNAENGDCFVGSTKATGKLVMRANGDQLWLTSNGIDEMSLIPQISGMNMNLKFLATQIQARNKADSAYMPFGASAFNIGSDRNIKKNITPYMGNALAEINSTQMYQYHYLNELDTELKHTGVIMQESPVEIVDPGGVGVDIQAMGSMAWRSIQQLSDLLYGALDEIELLKQRVEELEAV